MMESANNTVSVIVPTKNSEKHLSRCLQSITDQTYKKIEIIVVDNFSTDNTKVIANTYTNHFYTKGPERSSQVNCGVENATGNLIYKVDSDFVLDKNVIEECVDKISEGYDAVVVHNSPDVSISWIAKIRKFEVDMYKYDLTHSSARFIKKDVYKSIGGFNPNITAGEDYDFQNKLNRAGYRTGFVKAEALHLGEPTNIIKHLKKYYDYGRDFIHYSNYNKSESKKQLAFFRSIYIRNWRKFLRNPMMSLQFLMYNFLKFGFAAVGYFYGKLKSN